MHRPSLRSVKGRLSERRQSGGASCMDKLATRNTHSALARGAADEYCSRSTRSSRSARCCAAAAAARIGRARHAILRPYENPTSTSTAGAASPACIRDIRRKHTPTAAASIRHRTSSDRVGYAYAPITGGFSGGRVLPHGTRPATASGGEIGLVGCRTAITSLRAGAANIIGPASRATAASAAAARGWRDVNAAAATAARSGYDRS